ncbi:endonuclease/exonuclease/phosphatase family protein [Halpernia frigidisoli]|uniref:Endonuclease/Exonuclease/phosphatase family protein n=1 Tax=Halpernia frigidisoli TaxID=1125876 RepID=A0A1I3GNZ3_9FLAO|nr:endonuclease/exonuclease/phosphatase family protein [Halpernia frigidisoli]SFI25160.1 Endonuclease/Exonuclease/phosphatase family protein [Halpernia frigidisoli]
MKILRFVFLLIHLGIITLLLGNFLNIYVSPKTIPYLNFLSLAFPVLMILNLILILFWILLWKKRAFFFIILSLFLIKPTSRIINFNKEKKENANLKIITLNAHAGDLGRKNIEDFIDKEDPDILFLQEAGPISKPYNFKSLEYKKTENIVFFYSKYSILDSKDWLPKDNAHVKSYDISIRGKIYRFINIYLEPFYLNKSMVKPSENQDINEDKFKSLIKTMIPAFKSHQTQVAEIRKAVDNSPYPVIMAGDFNSVPNSYEYYHAGKGLQDAFEVVGSGSATSFHDWKFPIRIDYVFASKEITPISYKVDRSTRLSDHFPVIATFKIK